MVNDGWMWDVGLGHMVNAVFVVGVAGTASSCRVLPP